MKKFNNSFFIMGIFFIFLSFNIINAFVNNFNSFSLELTQLNFYLAKKLSVKEVIRASGLNKNFDEIKKIILKIKDLQDIKELILLQYEEAIFIAQRVKFDLWVEDFTVKNWLEKINNKKILDFIVPNYKPGKDLYSDQIRNLWLYVLLLNNNSVNLLNIKSTKILDDFYKYIFIITEFLHDVKSSKIDYLEKVDLANIKKLLIQNFNELYGFYDLFKGRSPAKSSDKIRLQNLMLKEKIIT